MLAIIALAGLVSWQQLKERKEKIDESIDDINKAIAENYLSLAAFNLMMANPDKPSRGTNHKDNNNTKKASAQGSASSQEDKAKDYNLDLYLGKARDFAEKFQTKLPQDFRGPRLMGQINYLRGEYQEAFRQFQIAKQKVDKADEKDPDYPSLLYMLAVIGMISCKKLKDRTIARRGEQIKKWFLEAFMLEPRLMDYAVDDDDFRDPENSERDAEKNPWVKKLNELIKNNKGIEKLTEADVKEWENFFEE